MRDAKNDKKREGTDEKETILDEVFGLMSSTLFWLTWQVRYHVAVEVRTFLLVEKHFPTLVVLSFLNIILWHIYLLYLVKLRQINQKK